MNRNGKRHSIRMLMAAMITACMIMCAFIPAIGVNDKDNSVYASSDNDAIVLGDDGTINYVSIGASNTNGYGMRGYISSNEIEDILNGLMSKDDANVFGYLKNPEGSYPDLIRDHYESLGYNVNLTQLAMSSMRVEEVRILLDETYYGDEYTLWRFLADSEDEVKWFDKAGGLDALRESYVSSVSNADLITIDIGWNNFGVYISHQISSYMSSGELWFDTDLSQIFDNEEDLEYALKVKETICEYITEYVDIDEELVTMLTDVLAYSLFGYIHNFDIVIDKIYELNPNVQIVVLGIQNLLYDLNIQMDGNVIPLGDYYGYIVNLANYYIAHCSPHEDDYLYAMPGENGHVNLFFDKIKNYESGSDITVVAEIFNSEEYLNIRDCFDYYDNDISIPVLVDTYVAEMIKSKYGDALDALGSPADVVKLGKERSLPSPYQEEFDSIYYPALYSAYDTMAQIVKYVANMECLNLDGLENTNVNATEDYLYEVLKNELMENANLAIQGQEYTVDMDDLMSNAISRYVVSMHMRTGIGNSFFVHPSELGHEQVANAVISIINNPETEKDQIPQDVIYTAIDIFNNVPWDVVFATLSDNISEVVKNILGSEEYAIFESELYSFLNTLKEFSLEVYNQVMDFIVDFASAFNKNASVSVYGDSSFIHAEPAYVCGTVVNLGDSNACGFGLEDYDLSYDNLVAEALGINPETQLHDYAYPGLRIQDIRAIFDESVVLDGYAANFEDYIANARENIQDFADADLILLNAGSNNFRYLLDQINNYLNGDEVYEMDFSQISILDDETKTNLMTMQFIMDELINTIEDENLRFNLGLMSVVVQANAYGYLTFVDNYIPTVMMIKSINPDVNIVNIGTCNQFGMLYYNYGCVNIDVGTLLGYGVELYNIHIEQFAKITGTTYVDIFDANTLGTEVAEAEGWANLYNTDENGVPLAHHYFAGDAKYTHLSVNGHAYVADQIMAALDGFTMHDHIMGDWNVVEEPKEGVEGTKVRYCDICGAEQYGTIPALEHNCVPGTEYKFDETGHWYECVCGEKFEITEHDFALNYEVGMLGHYGVCDCGYVGDIVEHVWSEADQDGVSHCECGTFHDCFPLNRYVPHEDGHWQECAICKAHNEVIGHTLKVEYDNNLHWDHCEICGYYSEKVNHIMGDWTVTTPAEEGKNGEKMRECTGCDYVETQVIPALEHVCVPGTEWFYDDNRHWHVCECTLKHDVSDHNITVEFGDETHWVYCDICEYIGMENLHIMGDWTITIPPQADAEGEKMRECTGCDYFETQAIPRGETEVDSDGNTTTVVITPEGDVITTTVKTDGTTIKYTEAADGNVSLITEYPDGSTILEYTFVEIVDNGESVTYVYMEKDSEGNNVKYNSSLQWNSFDESITVRAVVDSENGVDLTSQMTVVINLVGSDGPEDITDVLSKTITMAEDYIGEFNHTGIPDQSTIVVDIDDEDFDVEISPYVLSMISDSNTQLSIGSGCYAILIEKDLALSLAGHGDKIGISMKEADYNGLNEEQLEALGDRTLFAIEANAGGNAIHDLGSKTAIGLNFSDENVPNPVVCYMDENGDLVTLDTTYSEGWIVFYTDHFSYFAVMDESDLKSVFIIDAFGWVLVGIMVLIGLAVVFLRKN